MDKIIRKRVAYAQTLSKGYPAWRDTIDSVCQLIERVWTNQNANPVLSNASALQLANLNNHSIRVALEMVQQFTEELLKDIRVAKRTVSDYTDKARQHDFKGRVVRWFLQHEDSKALIEIMRRQSEAQRALTSTCDPHRLLLTFLIAAVKKTGPGRLSAGDVARDFNWLLDLDRDAVYQILMDLFESPTRQGEFIEIHQQEPVVNSSSIQHTAAVEITERGTALLDYILLAIDYWGHLAHDGARDTPLLFELPPPAALRYVRCVVSYVQEVAKSDVRSWCKKIAPKFSNKKEDPPFDHYRALFAYKEAFYLTRVADSHRDSVVQYVAELMRGPGTGIFMSAGDLQEFSNEWIGTMTMAPGRFAGSWDDLQEAVAGLEHALCPGSHLPHVVRELMGCAGDYVRLIHGLACLKAMSSRVLEDFKWEEFAEEYFGSRHRGTTQRRANR